LSIFNLQETKIINKKITVGVIGLGYVGLPLAMRFSSENFQTFGFDIDIDKVQLLNQGKSYINHIDNIDIKKMIDRRFKATDDFSLISKLDAIIICVPTPLKDKKPDLSFVKNTVKIIKPYLKENQLLVLESTTYPGTTEEELVPVFKNMKFKLGQNFFVGYSPEREDPGNKNFNTKNIPKVISGYSKNCKDLTNLLYSQVVDRTVPVSSLKVAEMTKILENIHRAVNIGLVNELKMVADKMDININEVISAAATKPFGFTPYYPGPGLGGHCIPIDPFYLTWKAKQLGINTRFIELAGEINTKMPDYVIDKLEYGLAKVGQSLNKSKLLILGLSYKKNVDDTRESPSFVIIEKLIDKGAQIEYSDPYIPTAPKTRNFNIDLKSVHLSGKTLSQFDAVLLLTNHDSFDYDLIKDNAKLIIDTRGVYNPSDKIICG